MKIKNHLRNIIVASLVILTVGLHTPRSNAIAVGVGSYGAVPLILGIALGVGFAVGGFSIASLGFAMPRQGMNPVGKMLAIIGGVALMAAGIALAPGETGLEQFEKVDLALASEMGVSVEALTAYNNSLDELNGAQVDVANTIRSEFSQNGELADLKKIDQKVMEGASIRAIELLKNHEANIKEREPNFSMSTLTAIFVANGKLPKEVAQESAI